MPELSMKLLRYSIRRFFSPSLCLALLTGVSVGQVMMINSAHLVPGVLYCSNESSRLLCSDDGGISWHDPDDFRGRYRNAWLLTQGRSQRTTIPVTTEVKPGVEKKNPAL